MELSRQHFQDCVGKSDCVNATSQSRNVTDSDVDDEIQEGSSILPTRKRLLYMTLACTSAALCNVFCSALLRYILWYVYVTVSTVVS